MIIRQISRRKDAPDILFNYTAKARIKILTSINLIVYHFNSNVTEGESK